MKRCFQYIKLKQQPRIQWQPKIKKFSGCDISVRMPVLYWGHKRKNTKINIKENKKMRTMINDKFMEQVNGGWKLKCGTELTDESIDYFAEALRLLKPSPKGAAEIAEAWGYVPLSKSAIPVTWDDINEEGFIDYWASFQKYYIHSEKFANRKSK